MGTNFPSLIKREKCFPTHTFLSLQELSKKYVLWKCAMLTLLQNIKNILIDTAVVSEYYTIWVTSVVTSLVKSDYLLHWNLDRSVNNGKDVWKLPKGKFFTGWDLVSMFGGWNLKGS